jgi:glycosyltransferase involved in cell wall biosynthesis
MMRVLLDVSAVPARPVGAGVYTIELARGLATRADVELHLAARRDDGDRWRDVAPGSRVHAVAPRRRPGRLAWEQTTAAALARRTGAHVWHGPHYTMPLRIDLPTVVTFHDLTWFDHPEWHERTKVPFFRTMIRASAARADVALCVSEETARRLRAVTGTTAAVTVAHHGVDHDRFRPDADPAADLGALAAHGITPPFVAAHPGTVEPRKDVPTLVAAFARVAAARPDLRLVISGADGWGSAAAIAAITRSGVASRVVRPGYLPAGVLPAMLRRAEVVAYPSRYEGFGLPALEALACGAPLVTTRGSALEEVVGDAARLVPPADVDALAGALDALLADAAARDRLRAAGPVQAARFTWSACVDRHLEAYATATARHRPVGGGRTATAAVRA